MIDAEKIKKALMIDEAQLQEEILQRVSQYLRIDSKGRVFLDESWKYRLKDGVSLFLIGRKYAYEAGLQESDDMSVTEISEALGLDSKNVGARLSELRNEGKIESTSRGRSRVIFPRVVNILNEIDTEARKWKPMKD